MRKVNLDLDQLNVDSFATTDRKPAERGTVHGREWTDHQSCWDDCETHSGLVKCECQPVTFGDETCYPSGLQPCSAECSAMSCGPDICA